MRLFRLALACLVASCPVNASGQSSDEALSRALASLVVKEQERIQKGYFLALERFSRSLELPSRAEATPRFAGAIAKAVWSDVADLVLAAAPKPVQTVLKGAVKAGIAASDEAGRVSKISLQLDREDFVAGLALSSGVSVQALDNLAFNLASNLAKGPRRDSLRKEYEAARLFLESAQREISEDEVAALTLLEMYEAWLNNTRTEPKGSVSALGPETGAALAAPGMLRIDLDFSNGGNTRASILSAWVEPSTPFGEQTAAGINLALQKLSKFDFGIFDLCVVKRVCLTTDEIPDFPSQFNCGRLGTSNGIEKWPVATTDGAHARIEAIANEKVLFAKGEAALLRRSPER